MESKNSSYITFRDPRDCILIKSGRRYQRVSFKTHPGLSHEALKASIARVVGEIPDNLTWDAESGEGAFCLLREHVDAGNYYLPHVSCPSPKPYQSEQLYNGAVLKIVNGDLFAQDTVCLVNPWNFNLIPHWILLPGGVSGKMKQIAGIEPFRQVRRKGLMWPGTAVVTEGGKLNRPVIHVSGLNFLWRSSPAIVSRSTQAALRLAEQNGFTSIALPLIGAGTGGLTQSQSLDSMASAVLISPYRGEVRIIIWNEKKEQSL